MMISRLMTLGLLAAIPAIASPVPVTDVDMVMASQGWGELGRNVSVSGKPLTIAGKTYASGLGTHAISEIPVTVPEGAVSFRGAVGVDDGAGVGKGSVRFRVLSGSGVLWESTLMKAGDPAVTFDVPLAGRNLRKLYLIADDDGNKDFDHADWVGLEWGQGSASAAAEPRVFSGKEFGLVSGIRDDQTEAMRKAIDRLRQAPGSTLKLDPGDYHFHATNALKRHFHISNHDQPDWHPVSVPLVDLGKSVIDGQGSLFLFHGEVLPLLIQDSENVTVRGISLDYVIPHHSQGIITKAEASGYEVEIDTTLYPHGIRDGWFVFKGEGWEARDGGNGIIFDGRTRCIVPGTSDYSYKGVLTVLAPGHYRIAKDVTRSGIKAGDVITFRQGGQRPHPAVTLYRAKNTFLDKVFIHSSHGMGILAQRSENIRIDGGGILPRKGSGRYFSTGADASHFSNCKGLVISENGEYDAMMDDAINVHATCLRIEEIMAKQTLRLRYVHPQAIGFETILPGETIRFIQAKILTPRDPRKVVSVRKTSDTELIVTLDAPVPDDLGVGDAVENADWFPAVTFRGNLVHRNRARGALFTTPQPVLVESNRFEDIAGSAILLAGDANGWYESGGCHDVTIRNNVFKNNLSSRFQFTEALLSFYPEVPDLKDQTEFYHRKVLIANNSIETSDIPLVFAISTDGITFRGNTVTYNNLLPAWKKPPFLLNHCRNFQLGDNRVTRDGKTVTWTAADVSEQ